MYRTFVNDYYDVESGPHRMKLLEHDLGLASKSWVARTLFRLGFAILPIALVGSAIEALRLFAH